VIKEHSTLAPRPYGVPGCSRQPAKTGRLLAISLFSGTGGLDLGVSAAGFDVRAAVENEADAAATLRANQFDGDSTAVIERSILEVSTEELLERAGAEVGGVDLVFGGPPCTPFSKSGYWLEYKRKGLDPNATLLDEFTRIVGEAKPRAALLENVHGLAYRNHNARPFEKMMDQLRAAGYSVAAKVLNAADFGVPQLRKRLFVYATRDGEPPAFPSPTHSGWSETSRHIDERLLPYVTSEQIIGDLVDRDDLAEPNELVAGKYGHLLPEIPPGGNYLHFTAERGYAEPLFRWRSRFWTFLLKLDPDRPSTTIQSQPGPYIGPFHWNDRRLRLLEVKRLQTFPDNYKVAGSRRSAQVQLGNAVPPILAAVVAGQLIDSAQ